MDAVKIKLYQNLVNYRRELSFGYVQTYPLPTPSMVKGMVHSLLDLNEFNNLKISIQGKYSTIITNMQKVFKFDRKGRYRESVIVGISEQSINRGLLFIDLIVDMELILHIQFDNQELNSSLYEVVQRKPIILGRNEDIARLDEVKIVKINEKKDADFPLKNNIYLDFEFCRKFQIKGTAYRLPFYYDKVDSFQDKRIFKYVDVMYVASGENIIQSSFLIDEEEDIVNFLYVDI